VAGAAARAEQIERIWNHRFVVPPGGHPICENDPELFFSKNQYDQKAAKGACSNCPLMAQCRLEGLINPGTKGVWGGLSTNDRQSMSEQAKRSEIRNLQDVLGLARF